MNGDAIDRGQTGGSVSQTGGSGSSPRPRPRPTTLGYWLAALVVLAALSGGAVLAGVTGFDAYERLTDMPRASVPGNVTFDVTKTGDQLVYYIGDAHTSWHQLGVTVTGPDGQAVQVSNDLLGTRLATITAQDHHNEYATHPKFAVATFRADLTGRYDVATASAAENGAEIAVGENLLPPVLFRLVGALAIVLTGIATGVVLIIVTAVRRSAAHAA
jgi:hypothetical protein